MPFKDWAAFLASKDPRKVEQAADQSKLLLLSLTKERKNVYDAVIGQTLLSKYGSEIDACNGVNYDAIQSERFFDKIENECSKLFSALNETDNSILNKMMTCLKVFLIKNPFLFYQTSWSIMLYVLNKHFTMAVSYQYFSYLIIHVFPSGFFSR